LTEEEFGGGAGREQYFKLVWSIKLIRNWYRAHLRKLGIKWRWKGKGVTALIGVALVNQTISLRL